MPATNLSALIDPEVMGAMIQAQLPKAIKFSGINIFSSCFPFT